MSRETAAKAEHLNWLLLKEDFAELQLASPGDASKVMLKIFQARLQQYVNCELPDVQVGFRRGRETRYQIANIRWIIEKTREFQKNTHLCCVRGFPGGSDGKASICNVGDPGSIPG